MFAKIWFVFLVALCGCLAQTPANALTVTNPLDASTTYKLSSFTKAGSSFIDYYYFNDGNLTGPSNGLLTLTSASAPPAKTTISSLSFVLSNSANLDTISGDLLSYASFVIPFLADTNYLLTISGTTSNGPGDGLYGFTLTTTPVPPALILFGSALIGLAGLAGRSRRKIGNKGVPLNV